MYIHMLPRYTNSLGLTVITDITSKIPTPIAAEDDLELKDAMAQAYRHRCSYQPWCLVSLFSRREAVQSILAHSTLI